MLIDIVNRQDFNIGEVLVITSGEYSQYYIDGVYNVVKPFSQEKVLNDFSSFVNTKEDVKAFESLYYTLVDPFIKYLEKEGYIREIEAFEMHIGV